MIQGQSHLADMASLHLEVRRERREQIKKLIRAALEETKGKKEWYDVRMKLLEAELHTEQVKI